MFILRLEPPLEVDCPKGRAWAILFRDLGHSHDDLWTCVIAETREIWTFPNSQVRAATNYTFGIGQPR
jgi:hypothetical protein